MSAVILRCDNCGTSQSARGLCEACHEGQVRYFCTNHDPGRWLETPKCPKCGAEYGVTVPPPPRRPDTGDLRIRRKAPSPSDPPTPATRPGKRTGGPWGLRPPRAPEEILVSDEAVARARAVDRLRRLLDAARYGRRNSGSHRLHLRVAHTDDGRWLSPSFSFNNVVLLTSLVSRPRKFRDLNAWLLGR